MRISDWSSDVCSSDLRERLIDAAKPVDIAALNALQVLGCASNVYFRDWDRREDHLAAAKLVADRRPSSRHTVTHLVLEETNDWGEYYSVKPITDIRNGEKAMVHVKTNHPCPAFWPSFLRFRSNDRKSTRLNSSHSCASSMQTSA